MAAGKLIARINPSNSALFVCDLQEKFAYVFLQCLIFPL